MVRDRSVSRRRFLASAGVAAVGALSGCLGEFGEMVPAVGPDPGVGDWPTIRGNVQNTAHVGDGDVPPETLASRWSFDAEAVGSSSPAIGDDLVFFASSGTIYGLDRGDGSVTWERVGGLQSGLPTLADGRLFVWTGGLYDELHAYRAKSGKRRWAVEIDDEYVMAPVVADGTVYATTDAGNLIAFGARGGKERWRVETGGDVSVPAVHDGVIYVPAPPGLLALDVDTGEERWRADTGGLSGLMPAADDGTVFTGGEGIRAIDAETGEERWRTDLDLSPWNAPAVVDDAVYVGAATRGRHPDGLVHALDAETGAERWRVETPWPVRHALAVARSGSRHLVYAVDERGTTLVLDGTDGTRLFEGSTGSPVVGPAVRGSEVYLGAPFGHLYAFRSA